MATGAVLPPVDLVFDRVGFWPRPAVVFAGADRVPTAVESLAAHLDAAAETLGIAPDRHRFRPHCTLFRKARRRPSSTFEPLCWRVGGFVLVESVTDPAGVRYRVVGEWSGE